MKTKLTTFLKAVKRQASVEPENRRHCHVAGLPGWGKTRSLESLSKIHCVLPCPLLAREDITVPSMVDGRMALLIHPMIQDFLDLAEANPTRPAVLIFDEIMQAGPEEQKAYASIIYDRLIAGKKLPPNVITVSTGNLRSHQSGAGSTLAHLVGRMKIYEIQPDVEAWMDWGSQRLHPDVLAYVAMKPTGAYCTQDNATDEVMRNMYRDAARDYLPYPSARSWTALSDELKQDDQLSLEDFASHVGEARAAEFQALRGVKIPSHADLLEQRADMSSEPMAQWMCVVRLGQLLTPGNSVKTCRAVKNLNPEMVEVFLKVAGRTAQAYLKDKGIKVGSGHMALIHRDVKAGNACFFPGFVEELLAPGSRYAAVLDLE